MKLRKIAANLYRYGLKINYDLNLWEIFKLYMKILMENWFITRFYSSFHGICHSIPLWRINNVSIFNVFRFRWDIPLYSCERNCFIFKFSLSSVCSLYCFCDSSLLCEAAHTSNVSYVFRMLLFDDSASCWGEAIIENF